MKTKPMKQIPAYNQNVAAEPMAWRMTGNVNVRMNDAIQSAETAMDTAALQYVKGFGVQWNLQAAVAGLAQKGPVMQTEHRCGNYNFASPYWDQTRYNPNMPQNDHLYGEE